MAEQKKDAPAAPGTTAPTGAGSQGPAPEEQRSGVEAASAAPGERRAASPPAGSLVKASESGHPDAHKALADLQSARMNLEDARGGEGRDERVAAAERAVKDAQARLGELGFRE